jgi:3-deoxy-D-manno-octulosonic-acid transferase
VKDSALLAAYRLATGGLGLGGPLYLYWLGKTGHDDLSKRHERLGRPSLSRPDGKLALLHVASSAEALTQATLARQLGELGFSVLFSVRSLSRGPLHPSRLPQCFRQLSPLDTPQLMARLLDHWRPDIVLLCGAETMPNLIVEASARKIPIALANAELPARSFGLWRRFPGFARSLLERIDVCLAQTKADARRFAILGAPNVQECGYAKYDCLPTPVDQPALARLLARIGTRPLWVADRIYPGEEVLVLAAHRKLAGQLSGLLTVIVPHSPKRAPELAGVAAAMGLAAGTCCGDGETAPLPDVYIAHLPGEAGLFYRSGGIVFTGNSLRGGGGQNPVEAARLGCGILHGPDIENFGEIYQALDEAGGGAPVFDAVELAQRLALLLSDNAALRKMGRAAAAAAEALGGASDRIIQAIAPYISQGDGHSAGR